jgi:hypothetical protein
MVTVGQTYNYNVILTSNWTTQAVINLRVESSIAGISSNNPVTIPPGGTISVPLTTIFTPAGTRTVTYTVLFNTQVLDSMTKSIRATDPVPFSVTAYSFSPQSCHRWESYHG